MHKASLLAVSVLGLGMLLAACSAEPTATGDCLAPGEDGTLVSVPCEEGNGAPVASPTPPPDNGPGNGAPAGQTVFRTTGCGGCHTIAGLGGATGTTGPELTTIGATAGDRVSGLSAEEYIRQSIVEPNAFVVPDFSEGVMPQIYEAQLPAEDIDALVEYLSSLQ